MLVSEVGGYSTALGADDETFFDEERFVDFFQGAGVFTYGGGKSADTHRPAFEGKDERTENLIVDGIQAAFVDFKFIQGETRDFQIDASVSQYLGEVPHTLKQCIGDSTS